MEFSETEFEGCRFNGCDFSETVFERCKFIDCEFHQCNLSLLKLPLTRLSEVAFIECKLVGVDWTRASFPSLNLDPGLSFRQCILNDSSFFGLCLNYLVLEECKLHGVDFREASLVDAQMTQCDFSGSLFMRTDMQGADLTGSHDFHIDIFANRLAGAKFSRYEALSLLEVLDIELVD